MVREMFKNKKDFQLFTVILKLWSTKADHVLPCLNARGKSKEYYFDVPGK